MSDPVRDKLICFINSELLNHRVDAQLEADDDLLAGGLVDSLGIMRLIAFIEETYQIAVDPGDVTIEHFRTVDTMACYIEGRKSQ